MACKKPKRIFDIREGDEWHRDMNFGAVEIRIIDLVGSERIGYRHYGLNKREAVLKSSFRRWWRGAFLHSATDWSNRNELGDTPTCRLFTDFDRERNPVTKASLRQAIRNRIKFAPDCEHKEKK